MEKAQITRLASSKAGHDLGRIYAVVREEGDFLYVCDGTHRTLDQPKKKNKKHLQQILHFEEQDISAMKKIQTDEELEKFLKQYSGRRAEV